MYKIFLYIFLGLGLLYIFFLRPDPGPRNCDYLKDQADEILNDVKIKHCSVDSDCIVVSPGCPFQCNILVAEGWVREVKQKTLRYLTTCVPPDSCDDSCPIRYQIPRCLYGKCQYSTK